MDDTRTDQKQTILYDGSCPMCRVVLDRIESTPQGADFAKVDIEKDALPASVTKAGVEKEMHVIDGEGTIHRGSEAILTILDRYPRYARLARIGRLPVIRGILSLGYKAVAAHRHFIFGKSSVIFWLKNLTVLVLTISLLMSAKLWLTTRLYPLSPIVPGLPPIPYPFDHIIFILLLLCGTFALFSPKPRKYLISLVFGMGMLAIFDQTRWQPEFIEYLFLLLCLCFYSWDYRDDKGRGAAIAAWQMILAFTYLWSGLQKINPGFITAVFPWMLNATIHALPQHARALLYSFGVLVPFIEAGIGIGLLTKKYRRPAVVAALLMHAFILLSIGPFGYDWNTIVWPWQILMMCLVFGLFWDDQKPAKDFLPQRASTKASSLSLYFIIIIFFGVMPIFSFFGRWDSYLSFTLYSDNVNEGVISIGAEDIVSLPPQIRAYLTKTPSGSYRLDISQWSYGELDVPPYPETRIFENIGRAICAYTKNSTSTVLFLSGKPFLLSGPQKPAEISCSELSS